jgi:hypothetical protein
VKYGAEQRIKNEVVADHGMPVFWQFASYRRLVLGDAQSTDSRNMPIVKIQVQNEMVLKIQGNTEVRKRFREYESSSQHQRIDFSQSQSPGLRCMTAKF